MVLFTKKASFDAILEKRIKTQLLDRSPTGYIYTSYMLYVRKGKTRATHYCAFIPALAWTQSLHLRARVTNANVDPDKCLELRNIFGISLVYCAVEVRKPA